MGLSGLEPALDPDFAREIMGSLLVNLQCVVVSVIEGNDLCFTERRLTGVATSGMCVTTVGSSRRIFWSWRRGRCRPGVRALHRSTWQGIPELPVERRLGWSKGIVAP